MGGGAVILGDPSMLLLGLGVTLLAVVGYLAHARRRRRLAEFLGGPRAARRVFGRGLHRTRGVGLALVVGAGLTLAAAAGELRLAEPVPPVEPPVPRVVLAIDVSASMQASDVAPTRLARATEVARGVLDALAEAEVGLTLFAGTGYPIAPPTSDHTALRFFLDGVAPTMASATDPGTRLSDGVVAGLSLFPGVEDGGPDEPLGERAVILISDGEAGAPDPELQAALELARVRGITIHSIGVGTEAGATMAMPSGRYQLGGPVLDATGAPALSRLRESSLREIVGGAGGNYLYADGSDLGNDVAAMIGRDPTSTTDSSDSAYDWARLDLPALLGAAALLFLVAESLMGLAAFPGGRRVPSRSMGSVGGAGHVTEGRSS